MIERLQQLAPRERLVLGVGTALAILIVGWTFVWSPLQSGSAELAQEIADKSRLIVDLRRAAGLRQSSDTGPRSENSASLVVLVDQIARPLGLSQNFPRTSPQGQDAINVTFRDAPFDKLITWLIEFEQQYGVSVVSVSGIASAGPPGLVNGQILLQRS